MLEKESAKELTAFRMEVRSFAEKLPDSENKSGILQYVDNLPSEDHDRWVAFKSMMRELFRILDSRTFVDDVETIKRIKILATSFGADCSEQEKALNGKNTPQSWARKALFAVMRSPLTAVIGNVEYLSQQESLGESDVNEIKLEVEPYRV